MFPLVFAFIGDEVDGENTSTSFYTYHNRDFFKKFFELQFDDSCLHIGRLVLWVGLKDSHLGHFHEKSLFYSSGKIVDIYRTIKLWYQHGKW